MIKQSLKGKSYLSFIPIYDEKPILKVGYWSKIVNKMLERNNIHK